MAVRSCEERDRSRDLLLRFFSQPACITSLSNLHNKYATHLRSYIRIHMYVQSMYVFKKGLCDFVNHVNLQNGATSRVH